MMDLEKIRARLQDMLFEASVKAIEQIQINFNEDELFAFIFLPESGFVRINIALGDRRDVSTETKESLPADIMEMLKDHPDLLAKAVSHHTPTHSNLLDIARWKHIAVYSRCFTEINGEIDRVYDDFYDLGLTPEQIEGFFEELVTRTLIRLKSANLFDAPQFESDILLGIFFIDSTNTELSRRVSSKVNSQSWHDRVCAYYQSGGN